MKILLILAMIQLLPSCGRNNTSGKSSCRNKESMRIECRAINQPTYGYGYTQEMCNRTYSSDRCY